MPEQFQFDFDITERSVPVVVTQGGKVVYRGAILEPSENAARKWRNSLAAAQKFHGEEKAVTLEDPADSSSELVAACLKPPVQVSVVRSWPAKVVKRLFEWCKEAGDLWETPDSKEELDKLIAVLQKRRARLDDPKGSNGQKPTTTSSEPAGISDAPSTSTSASET